MIKKFQFLNVKLENSRWSYVAYWPEESEARAMRTYSQHADTQ